PISTNTELYKLFNDTNECHQYINDNNDKQFTIIIIFHVEPLASIEQLVASLELLIQIISMYIFFGDGDQHDNWKTQYTKLKSINTIPNQKRVSQLCYEICDQNIDYYKAKSSSHKRKREFSVAKMYSNEQKKLSALMIGSMQRECNFAKKQKLAWEKKEKRCEDAIEIRKVKINQIELEDEDNIGVPPS
ncbi:unnamed protein product, partial [Didymodactylos carnosus]